MPSIESKWIQMEFDFFFGCQSWEGHGFLTHIVKLQWIQTCRSVCQSALDSNLRPPLCKSRPFFNGLDLVGCSEKEVKPFPHKKGRKLQDMLTVYNYYYGNEQKRVVAMIIMMI